MAKRRDFEADIEDIQLPPPAPIQRGRGMNGIIGQQPQEIAPGTDTELSDEEVDELQRCEAIIERGLKTFFEVGAALLRVRDLRLYRVEYPTFEIYCQQRWDFSKTYANNLIAATNVRNNLTTIVVKELPANEAQARPLTRLKDPARQREAWERVIATAAGKITAAHVEAVVKELLAEAAPEARADQTEPAPEARADQTEPDFPATTEEALQHLRELAREYCPPLDQPIDTTQSYISLEAMQEEIRQRFDRFRYPVDTLYHPHQDQHMEAYFMPQDAGYLLIRVIATHLEEIDAVKHWLHLRLGVVFPAPIQPGPGEQFLCGTQRAYGHIPPAAREQPPADELAALRVKHDRLLHAWAEVRQQLDQVVDILDDSELPMERARRLNATSTRGEAAKPLLHALERILQVVSDEQAESQDRTPDDSGLAEPW